MKNRAEWLAVMLLALFCAGPAAARKSDRQQPMDIRADSSSAFTGAGKATLSGNVRITQGSLRVEADQAEITQNAAGEVARALLTGTPATLIEDLDAGGRMDARATQIDYDLGAQQVVLTGNAVVAQPQGELRGERITYNLETGRLDAGGPQGGNQVFLRIQPQAKQPPER